MGQPTMAQRVEAIEEKMTTMEEALKTMMTEQLKFQAELRSTVTALQTKQVQTPDKAEGSVNRGEIRGARHTSVFGGGGEDPSGVGARDWDGGLTGGRAIGFGNGYVQGNWKYRKLDMPIFDGSDPDGWILRVERYFGFYKLTEAEMLDAVVVALEGDALRWYQWENNRHPIRRWADLKVYLLRQFRTINGGSLYEQWLSTHQTSTVQEYRRKFIETAAPLERVTEEMLMGQFLNGLKEEIKTEVRLLNPICLEQAMEQAVRVEEKLQVSSHRRVNLSITRFGNYSNYSKSTTTISPYSLGTPTSPPMSRNWSSRSSESQASVQSPTRQSTPDVKRLTESELQEKRAKGLCYRCDGKWTVGHRCKKKELSVMLIAEEDGEIEGEDSEVPESPTDEVITEVSLNSVVGISNPKTMKLKGIIGDKEVIVMVDTISCP